MSAGYGRGHYGSEQLAPRSSRSGWTTIAVVAGLGAVIWFMLPSVGPKPEPKYEPPPAPPSPADDDGELGQFARTRGFPSTKAYEDSVIASAQELRAAGAKVELSPYLQHLEPRVEA